MSLDNIKIKDTPFVVRHVPDIKSWKSANKTHIIGVQLKGRAIHKFCDKKFAIGEQYIYFLNQSEEYQVDVIEAPEAYSVHFTTYEPIETESFSFRIKDISLVNKLIEKVEHSILSSCSKNTIFKNFYELCECFNYITDKQYHSTNNKLLLAKEYMDLHFKEKDCLQRAAEAYGVTRRRFNDIFKLYMNWTPNEYIIEKKCDLAKKLLNTNMLTVTQIAQMCGFDNVYYFSKVFKDKTGYAPTAFRKRDKKD